MKVSGFAIARNVLQADYPIRESLLSIAPLCDEIVVAVGNSDDGTREFIQNLPIDQLKIIDTIWNDELRNGGLVLSDETNKALNAVSEDSDWCFYIQADECIHENDIPIISDAMKRYCEDPKVQGLLFNYNHFYGSYDYLGDSRKWYRNEIRIVKNTRNIKSWKDAQGFRTLQNKKLQVKKVNASIYHYGWVKSPEFQQVKQKQFHRLWHDDEKLKNYVSDGAEFDYSSIDSLRVFTGNHPSLMLNRINSANWKFSHDISKKNFSPKGWFLYYFEKYFGIRLGEYKNYKIIR